MQLDMMNGARPREWLACLTSTYFSVCELWASCNLSPEASICVKADAGSRYSSLSAETSCARVRGYREWHMAFRAVMVGGAASDYHDDG